MIGSAALAALDLLEAVPDATVIVDQSGRIILANKHAEHLFGYDPGELIGRPVETLVPERARALHVHHRDRYAADRRSGRIAAGRSLTGRRRDGTEFPVGISLSTVETPEGRVIAASVRDETERRMAAEAQARLASIVESSTDAIISKTLTGVITTWNAAAERIYGYAAEEMVGDNVIKLAAPGDEPVEADLLRRIARGERVARNRIQRRRKGGDLVTVSLSLSPVYGETGAIVGAASISRDLTGQELAEAKFRGLLDAAPDAMVGIDAAGRIVLANAQTERMFGYGPDELVGQPVEILVPRAGRLAHEAALERDLNASRPRPVAYGHQVAARRRDGSEFPAEVSLSSMDTEDGRVVLASLRDVSERLEAAAERERLKAQAERERLEAQLARSQRLESLGQLAGGVAHDFNNLLAVILNYGAFVEEELQAAIDEGQADRWEAAVKDMGQIQRAAKRAISLTHQLLAFGRREVVRPRVVSLNDAVRDVQSLLRRTLGEHVRLGVRLEPRPWPVLADPGQLEQVLVNLAVNARQAMPAGGTLVIETSNATLDEEFVARHPGVRPGRHVRMTVGDTGVGMTPEVLARAFEPFFTTKPKGEGTGLGLATVYGIVAQAGGHTHIYSEPGIGTTVTVLVPATDQLVESADPAPVALRTGHGEAVLVVEDEDAMREVTRRILNRNGYQVLTAARGEEAIRLVSEPGRRVDLLLTDVVMPQMLGKEVAEEVRRRRAGLPVLYMSGYARPVLAAQGTLDPGVALVAKPFSEEELLHAVREVLDGPCP